MEIAEYRSILKSRFIPSMIVATRATTPARNEEDGWARAKDRNLEHNCWLIATADHTKRRRFVFFKISFDTYVDFPGRALSDFDLTADRLTKKILILECLIYGARGDGGLDAAYVYSISLKYDWILRLRLGLGIASHSALPPQFAELLARRLSSGGSLALVPLTERLELLAEKQRAGRWQIPMRKDKLDWIAFASILGVTKGALSQSRDFRRVFLKKFKVSKGVREAILGVLSPEGPVQLDADHDESSDFEIDDHTIRSDLTTTVRLEKHLEILEFIFRLSSRGLIGQGPLKDPFEAASAPMLLERFGTPVGRTRTLLPADMLRMMRISARWVAEYAEYIICCLRDYEKARSKGRDPRETAAARRLRPAGAPIVLLAWTRGSAAAEGKPKEEILLDAAVRFLLAACVILIGCFTARRSIGIDSVHYGCLTEGPSGIITMLMYIGKTDQDHVEIPVPEIMKLVVSVLEKLSEKTRAAKGTKWLFEVAFDASKPGRLISTTFADLMSEFLNFVGIEPPEGEDEWNIAVHMLRRGFGVWYYWGMQGANPDALSIMYRHSDPNMTRIYFTLVLPGEINRIKSELDGFLALSKAQRTPEQKKWIEVQQRRLSYLKEHHHAFNDAKCEVFVEKSIEIWMGAESVIGAGGRALFNDVMAIAESVSGRIRIASRLDNDPGAILAPLKEELFALARVSVLEPVIGTNMWCRFDPSVAAHAEIAECLKLKSKLSAPWAAPPNSDPDILSDFNLATNPICAKCGLGCGFNAGQAAIDEEVGETRDRIEQAATAADRRDAIAELAEIEAAVLKAGKPISRGI